MLPTALVLTGPESTGKTTLARQLAEHYGCLWVPEFARHYLRENGAAYTEQDLLEIARGQVATEKAFAAKTTAPLLFLDTSLEVIKIWSEVRYGRCHPWILEQLDQRRHDLYLLCQPDLPWQADPLRENPDDREKLFSAYVAELTALKVKFVEVKGTGENRLQQALQNIEQTIGKLNR